MTDIHDKRRIPLDPQPESRSLLESARNWIAINVLRRNKRDERQQKAAVANAPYRRADAERVLRQPGTAEKIAADFERVVSRVGVRK